MRRQTTDTGVEIYYPEDIAFIFSQMPVAVRNGIAGAACEVTLTVGDSTMTETRTLDGDGSLFLDISRMAQLIFPDKGIGMKKYNKPAVLLAGDGSLRLTSAGDDRLIVNGGVQPPLCATAQLRISLTGDVAVRAEEAETTLYLQWGAMDYDRQDDFKRTYRLRYWKGYPWSMPLWAQCNMIEGKYGEMGDPMVSEKFPDSYGWCQPSYEWMVTKIPETADVFARGGRIFAQRVPTEEGTAVKGDAEYTIVPTAAPAMDCVYLRWLTREGDTGYYLLGIKSRSRTAATLSVQRRGDQGRVEPDEYGVLPSTYWRNRMPGRIYKAGVDLTDEADFETIADMLQSPQVEMMHRRADGSVWWEHVNIPTDSVSRTDGKGRRLQRIELDIECEAGRTVSSW